MDDLCNKFETLLTTVEPPAVAQDVMTITPPHIPWASIDTVVRFTLTIGVSVMTDTKEVKDVKANHDGGNLILRVGSQPIKNQLKAPGFTRIADSNVYLVLLPAPRSMAPTSLFFYVQARLRGRWYENSVCLSEDMNVITQHLLQTPRQSTVDDPTVTPANDFLRLVCVSMALCL